MSDTSGFLPSNAIGNIRQRGADRLAEAQATLKSAIGKEQLTKGLEGGLGGLKLTTFGKDFAKSAYDRFGTYINQEGRKAVNNVVTKARGALRGGDDEPIQMGEIGEVEDEATTAVAPAEAEASSVIDGLGRFQAENFTGSMAERETVESALNQRFSALPQEAQASARATFNQESIQAGNTGREGATANISDRLQARSDAIKAEEDEVEADKQAVEGEDYQPPRPDFAPKPEVADEVEQAEGAPALPEADYTAGTGAEGATANLAAEGEVGGVAEATTTAEVGLTETVGGILDDTGILAPIGLLLGAVGVGLAAHKPKNPPTLHNVRPVTAGGFSYQVGV